MKREMLSLNLWLSIFDSQKIAFLQIFYEPRSGVRREKLEFWTT